VAAALEGRSACWCSTIANTSWKAWRIRRESSLRRHCADHSDSREGLGVADERSWRVPSLEVGAAVKLFVDRAQSSLADEPTAVEEFVVVLDGIRWRSSWPLRDGVDDRD